MGMQRFRYWFIVSFTILLGCSEDQNPVTPPTNEHLVSVEATTKFSAQNLRFFSNLLGIEALTNLIQHDVQIYKMVYTTHYRGDEIEASGLVYIPQSLTAPAPIISLHHGTTLDKSGAPSVTTDFSGLEFFGAAGYITIVPDFIGYGASDDIFHPYYDEEHSAAAVTDMLEALKEFLTDENISHDGKLFLAGYSEGGYVTLATAKAIELNPITDLSLTAVAAGAGGYDLYAMLTNILADEEYVYPSYFAFLLMGYNETNDWKFPITELFKEPYANALSMYMTGAYSGAFVNTKLTNNIQSLLTDDFFEDLSNPESESDYVTALQDNSIKGWNTSMPIRLYHGIGDEIIPYENSQLTLESFQTAGSNNVSLTLFPVGNHIESFTPTLIDVILWFDELK
jgi:pimeloyl-ACP methyl ester carboxylesterase